MTHTAGSKRASHCLRCRVIDWAVTDYKDTLHPRQLVLVPVVAPGYVPPSRGSGNGNGNGKGNGSGSEEKKLKTTSDE